MPIKVGYENCLKSKSLVFTIVALGNALGHSRDIGLAHPNIKVQYLSNTTTSLTQPLNH